jgi:hypothetical protein
MFDQRAEPFPTVALPLTAPVKPFPENLHCFPKELLQARVVAAHSIVVVVSLKFRLQLFEPVFDWAMPLLAAPFGEAV